MSDFFQHPNALIDDGVSIGAGTRVWAFAHIVKGATVGRDCNICDHTFIEGGASIGDRVTVKCGVYLWDGVALEDDVYVGPCVAFTNDPYPRSKKYLHEYANLKARLLHWRQRYHSSWNHNRSVVNDRRGVNRDPERAGLRFGRRQPCQTQRLDLSMRKAVDHR